MDPSGMEVTMISYTPPIRDMQFLLHELLDISASGLAGHEDLDPASTESILEAAGQITTEVLAPINLTGDQQGCRLEDGKVITPNGFGEAFDAMREGGWTALSCDTDHGGEGMPFLLNLATN